MRAARRAALVACLGLVMAAVAALPAGARTPPQPTNPHQPLTDGCQRNAVGTLFGQSPEWVYVYRNTAIRMATGVAHVSHVAKDDAPGTHESYDLNFNVDVDRPFRYLLGGSAAAGTGNFARGDAPDAEEYRRLHPEWESATIPSFAWPTDGDRVVMWGSWVWDCGHWTSGSKVTGERTEFHSLNGVVVLRRHAFRTARDETQADVFISNRGMGAHAEAACALTHHEASSTTYDSGFKGCVLDKRNYFQPLLRSYRFVVPAPRRPSRGARIAYRVALTGRHTAFTQRIRRLRSGTQVTVSLRPGRTRTSLRRFGAAYYVGWTGRQPPRAERLRVTLRSLLIRRADPLTTGQRDATGNWNLWLDVNGSWRLLNDWAPKLASVVDGQRIAIDRALTVYVPRGAPVSVFVQGHECDEPADIMVAGNLAPNVAPCPPNHGEFQLANDDPGLILDTYRSARAALGTHTSRSVPLTRHFGGPLPITFNDAGQGNGDYELTYRVARG